jgi:hypothetical protein
LPDEWDIGVVCLLHKKGDLMVYNNYRGVMLLNIVYKVLSNILFNHLFLYTEKITGNYQCRVWPDRSIVSKIFTIR